MKSSTKNVIHGAITTAIGIALNAFTLALMWKWFIHPLAPTVLVPSIPLPLALGLGLFLTWGSKGLLVSKAYADMDEPYDPKRSWYGIAGTLTFLGLAAIYHFVM